MGSGGSTAITAAVQAAGDDDLQATLAGISAAQVKRIKSLVEEETAIDHLFEVADVNHDGSVDCKELHDLLEHGGVDWEDISSDDSGADFVNVRLQQKNYHKRPVGLSRTEFHDFINERLRNYKYTLLRGLANVRVGDTTPSDVEDIISGVPTAPEFFQQFATENFFKFDGSKTGVSSLEILQSSEIWSRLDSFGGKESSWMRPEDKMFAAGYNHGMLETGKEALANLVATFAADDPLHQVSEILAGVDLMSFATKSIAEFDKECSPLLAQCATILEGVSSLPAEFDSEPLKSLPECIQKFQTEFMMELNLGVVHNLLQILLSSFMCRATVGAAEDLPLSSVHPLHSLDDARPMEKSDGRAAILLDFLKKCYMQQEREGFLEADGTEFGKPGWKLEAFMEKYKQNALWRMKDTKYKSPWRSSKPMMVFPVSLPLLKGEDASREHYVFIEGNGRIGGLQKAMFWFGEWLREEKSLPDGSFSEPLVRVCVARPDVEKIVEEGTTQNMESNLAGFVGLVWRWEFPDFSRLDVETGVYQFPALAELRTSRALKSVPDSLTEEAWILQNPFYLGGLKRQPLFERLST